MECGRVLSEIVRTSEKHVDIAIEREDGNVFTTSLSNDEESRMAYVVEILKGVIE